MISKNIFIKATEEFNTFENPVPAYYFRKTYVAKEEVTVTLTIAVCGFYELYFNGKKITRGLLSPYISNPDHYIYADEYEITLSKGKNVFGVVLGNGFQNNPGGYIWEFDEAPYRSAPMFAMTVVDGDNVLLTTEDGFKTSPSPIRSDDYRFGEYYDANFEIDGWNRADFDDCAWGNALTAIAPKGEIRIADTAPIVKECEMTPVEIIKCDDGYIYDFGISNAGICRLTVKGTKGQKITIRFADSLEDGDLNIPQVWFVREKWEHDKDIVHKDTYVCKGEGKEVYEPSFTYHGFRYAKVHGVTEEQATKELLTYLVYHTVLNTRGDFVCSDATATKLQELTRRSIVSNFHHFPTDCPQREKNGWTADAALTSEAALMNFDPERNYREWMRNICKAQREDGAFPGIVPTGGWGYHWGNGPAWDCVLAWLPYYTYIYRGETDMIRESADAFITYLKYLRTRCDKNGLLAIGLGDWCHVNRSMPKSPLIVTDSITTLDIANKIAFMLDVIGKKEGAKFARDEAAKYRDSIRANLVETATLRVMGDCQTSQALALHYGVFDESEEQTAFNELLTMVHESDDHIDVGVLGGRVIFHVLSKFGYSNLAFRMITRDDFPSYGNWIKRGATTLWENFMPDSVDSMNHHFWGDISSWFIKYLAGIQFNPTLHNIDEVVIKPDFIDALNSASAYYIAPKGKIFVFWEKKDGYILLNIEIPDGVKATAKLEDGYAFEDGSSNAVVTSGTYRVNFR